jgi:DNA-binding transcriptional LysR family regulator
VRLTDTKADLIRDGVDLAVRIGRMQDSTLVARRVDQQGLVLCASPAYLKEHGAPRRIEELANHAAVVFRLPTSGRDRPWQFRQRGGEVGVCRPCPTFASTRPRVCWRRSSWERASASFRICWSEAELARGDLVELLPSCRPEAMPISIVYPSGG